MIEGLIYQFAYNLEQHRLFNIRLQHWLLFLCFVVPFAMWLKVLKVSTLTASLVTIGAVCVLATIWWAARQRYARFMEQDQIQTCPVPQVEGRGGERVLNQQSTAPLPPAMSKVRVRATGFFEVGNQRRYFVETPADYTTFETREHCVMTRIARSRFLLLGESDQDMVGWWYTFFQPSTIRAVNSGCLYFGLRPRPALRVEMTHPDTSQDEVLYLSFDDEATCSLILADLNYDADLG